MLDFLCGGIRGIHIEGWLYLELDTRCGIAFTVGFVIQYLHKNYKEGMFHNIEEYSWFLYEKLYVFSLCNKCLLFVIYVKNGILFYISFGKW